MVAKKQFENYDPYAEVQLGMKSRLSSLIKDAQRLNNELTATLTLLDRYAEKTGNQLNNELTAEGRGIQSIGDEPV